MRPPRLSEFRDSPREPLLCQAYCGARDLAWAGAWEAFLLLEATPPALASALGRLGALGPLWGAGTLAVGLALAALAALLLQELGLGLCRASDRARARARAGASRASRAAEAAEAEGWRLWALARALGAYLWARRGRPRA